MLQIAHREGDIRSVLQEELCCSEFSINSMLQVAHREGDTRTVMLEGYEGEEQVGGAGPSEMPLLDSKVR
jgi:hypothetical protein